ncbi:hypothetical protein [Geobacillus stearothermophilus]|uniref:hypothetical protein n=1 Tax=Geobacillus stearothermophilus TaxID=1422 RepID=UPI002402854B|nr:hypothetical protein [Geobacillus stearothermophilus]MDF9297679.1 hypothetical protein [Geobacillus stearothermophilus]
MIVLLFRSVACSIIAGSKKNARGKCNKKEEKLGSHSTPYRLHRRPRFFAPVAEAAENSGLKNEKAVMMKRGMFAVVREYI